MKLVMLLLAGAALSGCTASAKLGTGWLSKDELAFDATKYPDDAAVVLYRADKWLLEAGQVRSSEVLRHQAVAVLREGGFSLAEVKIPFRANQELLELKARVIKPDGTVRELDARDMLSDTNGKGEQDLQAKFFRFPDVTIGSILEYVSVVRMPWVMSADDQDTLGTFPVKRYDFELTGARVLVLEAIEYNSTRPIDVTTLDDGRHRLRFTLEDLAPRKAEPWTPHWTFTEPRWAFRVIGWKSGQITTDWFREWHDVTENFASHVYLEAEPYAGFSERPDLSACSDAKCKVEKATDWVREKTSTLGVDTNRERPLAEAFKTGKASARERAMALRFVLQEAGVEARLAMTTEAFSRQTARSFPEWAQFNRALVWLPGQPGLPRPMAIDLEAEYCAAGELPPQVKDQPGFVFWMEGGTIGEGKSAGEWVTLDGPPCRAPFVRETHRAKLGDDGTLVDRLEVTAEGERSEPYQRNKRDFSARDFDRRMGFRATDVSPISWQSDAKWGECDRLKGVCGHSVTLSSPQYGVRDGAAWVVPLKTLTPFYDSFDAEQRQQSVRIEASSGVTEEVLELEGPPGFHVGKLPDTITLTAPGASVRVVAEKTKTGARISRRVSFTPGIYPATDYPKLREALEVFRSVRNTVLTFERD